LKAVIITVSLITVLMPAYDWVFGSQVTLKSLSIFSTFSNIPLFVSFFFLVWGFIRIIRIVGSDEHLVNVPMVITHMVAYSFILVASIVENFTITDLHSYEISTYCNLVINLACSSVLALIVHQICKNV